MSKYDKLKSSIAEAKAELESLEKTDITWHNLEKVVKGCIKQVEILATVLEQVVGDLEATPPGYYKD